MAEQLLFRVITEDHALAAPGGCAICHSNKRPLLDLMHEFGPNALRLYLCRIHAREVAKSMGYAKGERMAALDGAMDRIADADRERDTHQEAAHRLAQEVTRLQQEVTRLSGDLERERHINQALVVRAQQVAAQANELVIGVSG